MAERWRKPAGIVAVEPYAEGLIRYGHDNRLMRDYDVTVTAETYERMREGRMCGQCYEPFEEPWPEVCNVCRFRVREEQARWLEATFQGEQWIGSRETISDELARLDETNERAKHVKNPKSQIVIPPWAGNHH